MHKAGLYGAEGRVMVTGDSVDGTGLVGCEGGSNEGGGAVGVG